MINKNITKILAFVALISIAGLSFAGGDVGGPDGTKTGVWTVYAFGNAQAIHETFMAISNFVASSTFKNIFNFVAVSGVLVVALTSGFQLGGGKKFIGYLLAVALISYVFTGFGSGGLSIRVEIVDTVDGRWKAPTSVPIIVGLPAAVISTAGFKITEQIEASFTIPDALKLSNGAPFNLAAGLIGDAAKARISDAKLANSVAYYVQDCFTTGVAIGALDATVLLQSTDFLKDIKYANTALMVNTTLEAADGAPTLVNCEVAHNLIVARIGKQGSEATAFLSNASAWASTPALSVVNSAADAVANWASKGNQVGGGAAMVKQAAVISEVTRSYSTVAAATGNSNFLSTLAVEQAKSSQFNSWVVGAEMFNRTMGYIFAILQVFIYALAPIIFLGVLIPGIGGSLLKSFGQVLVWLALWQPLLAIVNFVVLSMQRNDLGGMMYSGGGGFGITLASIGIVSEKSANMRAASSLIGTMVPVLAWGMVKGAIDMTKFVASAGGEQFAGTAANTMATGNFSLNQGSMDSFTANKNSIAQSSAPGGGYTSADGIGNQKQDLGATTITAGGQAPSIVTTAKNGLTNTANTGTSSADVVGGSVAINGGTTAAAAAVGANGGSGQQQSTRATAESLAANAALSGRAGFGPSGNGGAGATVNPLTGAPALASDTVPPNGKAIDRGTTKQQVVKGAKALTPTASAQLSSAGSDTQVDNTGGGKVASAGVNGTLGLMGNQTYVDNKSASVTGTGAIVAGTDKAVSQTATALSSLADRADANRGARGEGNARGFHREDWAADKGSALHDQVYGGSNSSVNQASSVAGDSGKLAADQQARESAAAKNIANAGTKGEDYADEAHKQKAAAEKKAAANIAASKADVAAYTAGGKTAPQASKAIAGAKDGVVNTAGAAYDASVAAGGEALDSAAAKAAAMKKVGSEFGADALAGLRGAFGHKKEE